MTEELPHVNLLPKYERQSSRQFYLFIVMLVIVFLSLLLLGFYYFITKDKLQTAQAEYNQLEEQQVALESQVAQLDDTNSTPFEQAVAFAERHQIPTSTFITKLDELLPEHSYLSDYEYGSQVATISADFETLDTVASYTTHLTESDYIKDAKVDDIQTFTLKEDEQDESEDADFATIPRYEADFTLTAQTLKLKEDSEEDE